jgi:hypothetical protein
MLASVHTTLTQLGAANGLLYLLAVALGRISGHRIRLYRYLLVGQPVPPDFNSHVPSDRQESDPGSKGERPDRCPIPASATSQSPSASPMAPPAW